VRKSGFTLVEIMVATVIIVLAVIPIFDMISGANKAMASIEEEAIGFALAAEGIEFLNSLGYRELLVVKDSVPFLPFQKTKSSYIALEEEMKPLQVGGVGFEYAKETHRGFSRKLEVVLPDPKNPRAIRVVATVRWHSRLRQGKEGEIQLSFMKFELD